MNTLSIAHPTLRASSISDRSATPRTRLSVRSGVVDDIEREDDAKGYEPEARFHELVKHLVADGDRRALQSGLRARRTLGQMIPGHQRRELPALAGTRSARGE
ncbi:hypothetical protein ACFVVP_39325 [Streptomyces sp. NPDC058128]|uniref:hypothetical protein n=1 Tax=Streptomyces sp. NPDC058128 TaxID=3346352 RepID=UPI0036EAA524